MSKTCKYFYFKVSKVPSFCQDKKYHILIEQVFGYLMSQNSITTTVKYFRRRANIFSKMLRTKKQNPKKVKRGKEKIGGMIQKTVCRDRKDTYVITLTIFFFFLFLRTFVYLRVCHSRATFCRNHFLKRYLSHHPRFNFHEKILHIREGKRKKKNKSSFKQLQRTTKVQSNLVKI